MPYLNVRHQILLIKPLWNLLLYDHTCPPPPPGGLLLNHLNNLNDSTRLAEAAQAKAGEQSGVFRSAMVLLMTFHLVMCLTRDQASATKHGVRIEVGRHSTFFQKLGCHHRCVSQSMSYTKTSQITKQYSSGPRAAMICIYSFFSLVKSEHTGRYLIDPHKYLVEHGLIIENHFRSTQ